MPSRLQQHPHGLAERLGLLRFVFDLDVDVDVASLRWHVRSVHVLGVPLPRRRFTGVTAREFERDGRYHYDVAARLPRIGLLVHYAGWLDVDTPGAAA